MTSRATNNPEEFACTSAAAPGGNVARLTWTVEGCVPRTWRASIRSIRPLKAPPSGRA